MKKLQNRWLSLFLAVWMTLSCGLFLIFPTAAEGNEARIGDTEYATLNAAIDAARDGDTIMLLKDLSVANNYNKEIRKTITIDGSEAMYKITASGAYTFQFFQSFTLKNLKFDTTHGFRFYNTAGKDAVGTLENVDWTLGVGLLVNIQGSVADVPQTLNVVNSTITKKVVSGDPIIATYSHTDWAKPGKCDITINIDNSTLNQNGGQTNGHIGNTSMLYFCRAKSVTLNLKNNSVLNYQPMGKAGAVQALLVYEISSTVNAEAGVSVNLLESPSQTAQNAFFYKESGDAVLTVQDDGAAWCADRVTAARGVMKPAMNVYNGGALMSWSVADGEKVIEAMTDPFRYETESETVCYKFRASAPAKPPYEFRQEDLVMNAGASIRTEAPAAMAISGRMSKELYDHLEQDAYNIVYELYLVKLEDLEATKLGGTEYNLNLLGSRDKKSVNRIYWNESENGDAMLFRGCIYGLDVKTKYVLVASVSFVLDGTEGSYSTAIVPEDHVRSVEEIATRALADADYADNAYLKTLASGKN